MTAPDSKAKSQSPLRVLRYLPFLLFLALCALLLEGLLLDGAYRPSALIGKPVPPFSLPVLGDDERVASTEDLPAGPSLLNVWATWCPSCDAEHPYLMQLAARGIPIVGLNYKDKDRLALAWLEDKGDPYRFNIVDQRGVFALDLGVYGAPETYLIDADGIIRHRHAGPMSEAIWQESFAPLLRTAQESAR